MNFFQKIARRVLGVNEGRAIAVTGGSLANPASWLERALLGFTDEANVTGVTITEATALQISAVFACVRVISEDVAKLPLTLYRSGDGRRRERLPAHPLAKVLERPNRDMTSFDFRSTLTAHAVCWGNGYAEIVRGGTGRPTELWPMLPDCVRVEMRRDGTIVYVYANPYTGKTTTFDSSEVLHVKGPGYDGLLGYSIVGLARQSLGLTAAAERYGAAFFGNSSIPKGILEHPGVLGEEGQKNLRKSWEENHGGGPGKANRIGILEEGMKFHSISIPPEDAQFLETREFQIPEVCRWFRMPPHKIADLNKATFSNIEHQALQYVGDTLQPWLVRWEQEVERKLLLGSESSINVEHQTSALLRGDLKSRYEAHAIGRQWGFISANDVREVEGMNPIDEDAGGDVYLVPVNMANSEGVVDPPEPAPNAPAVGNPGADPSASPLGGDSANNRAEADVRALRTAVSQGVVYVFGRERRSHSERILRNAKRDDRAAWFDRFAIVAEAEIASDLVPFARTCLAVRGIVDDERAERISFEAAKKVVDTYRSELGSEWHENTDAKIGRLSVRIYQDAGEATRFLWDSAEVKK